MLRTIAERLARDRILRRTMLVAGKRVPIFVSPDAQLKYLKLGSRAFDRDLIELAERELDADSVVWDVGANVGTFSVAAATVAERGKVVAIEADIWLAGLLRRTARDPAHGGRIDVIPCAASDTQGIARFLIADRGRASNALESAGGRSQMGGVREVLLVPTLSLDLLLDHLPAPDFVKIDVEGAELSVLKGATRLLQTVRPRFYVEIGETMIAEAMELFRAADYKALDPATGREVDTYLDNTLFAPN